MLSGEGRSPDLKAKGDAVTQFDDFEAGRQKRNQEREAQMGDRTFPLCGETFIFKPRVSYTVMEDLAETQSLNDASVVSRLEASIIELLEDGQRDKFLAVARNQEDPLTWEDMIALCNWITEVQAGRPTQALSPSTGGDATTSTSSTGASSSKLVEASAA